MNLPILMCIADDTKWLFFRIVPPPSAGEQYTTKLGFLNKHATKMFRENSEIL